jgi:3-phenylpropionate/trans-cinnamate dioxygenase ferredoxin subunit
VKHDVGAVDEFAPGTIRIVKIDRYSIGIINNGSKLYAVLNVCPHELAPICHAASVRGTMLPSDAGKVKYGRDKQILRCPWHGYEFDLEDGGKTIYSSFKARVRMFPVSVEDGQVLVEVKDRPQERTADREPAETSPVS